jgi:hypothetical protein
MQIYDASHLDLGVSIAETIAVAEASIAAAGAAVDLQKVRG